MNVDQIIGALLIITGLSTWLGYALGRKHGEEDARRKHDLVRKYQDGPHYRF